MENQNQPSSLSNQAQRFSLHPTRRAIAVSALIAGLFLIGFLIEIGPKWDETVIHIPLSPGHGFTTQDAAALIPASLALILLVSAVWKYRPTMKQQIEAAPLNAFGLALILGLSIGLVLGIGLGMLFKVPFISFLKDVLKPLQLLFYG